MRGPTPGRALLYSLLAFVAVVIAVVLLWHWLAVIILAIAALVIIYPIIWAWRHMGAS